MESLGSQLMYIAIIALAMIYGGYLYNRRSKK